MIPAAGPAVRSVLRTTLGGRAPALAAGRVEAAPLRTLPLVTVPRLLALADRLAVLRSGPPALEQLGASVDRAQSGRTGEQGPPVPRAAAGPATGPATGPARAGAARGPRETGAPWPTTAPVTFDQGRPPPGSPPVQDGRPHDLRRPAAAPAGDPGPADDGRRPDATGRAAPSAPPRPPAAPPAPLRLTALARAARADVPHAAGPAPVAAGPDPVAGQDPARARTTPAAPAAIPAAAAAPAPRERAAAASPADVARAPADRTADDGAVPAGALGELLARWAAPPPDVQPPPAPAAPRGGSPFPPLTARLAAHVRAAGPWDAADPWDDGAALDGHGLDGHVLDTVQLALEALLRREAEQHGLRGGPG